MQEQKASHTVLSHVRANLWLLVLSIGILCVLYPAVVWVVGQLLFHDQAESSLVYKTEKNKDGKEEQVLVGSNLIAQSFTSPWFFASRPSGASYNAAASGAYNYAASNPKLRGRVATQLGTISRYSDAYKKAHKKDGGGDPTPQEDLLTWYGKQPPEGRWFDWANNNPTLAQAWATGSIQDYISWWEDKHPGVAEDWKKDNATATQPPGFNDLLPYFFRSYEKAFAGKWPSSESVSAWTKEKDDSGNLPHSGIVTRWKAANPDKGDPSDDDLTAFFPDDSAKNPNDWPTASAGGWVDVSPKAVVQPTAFQDSDIQGTFFDTWYTEQVKAGARKPEDFRQVPADMVTASGSGLDPDISLANALYQEEEMVVPGYAEKLATDVLARDAYKDLSKDEKQKKHDELIAQWTPEIKKHVDKALEGLPSRPMFGLTGDGPLVNVLQLNRRWQEEMNQIKVP